MTSPLTDADLVEMLQQVDADALCIFCGEVLDEEADHAPTCELLRLVQEVRDRR